MTEFSWKEYESSEPAPVAADTGPEVYFLSSEVGLQDHVVHIGVESDNGTNLGYGSNAHDETEKTEAT